MRVLLSALALFVAATIVCAQNLLGFPPGMFSGRHDGGAAFPAAILPNATAFYGLRAYSAAIAAPGTNVAVNVLRGADNHTCDLLIATNGNLGNTVNCSTGGDNGQSALSWLGSTTCTGTVSGTTLTCTSGAPGAPSANASPAGAGLTTTYITSCGAFAGGAGTCTLNNAIGTAGPETLTFVGSAGLQKWYDQSGNGYTITTQSGTGFNPIGWNGVLPSVMLPGGFFNATTITSAAPTYFTSVAVRQTAFTGAQALIGNLDTSINPNGLELLFAGSANNVALNTNSLSLSATATDQILHSIQAVGNGGSSVINVDGTETTGTTGSGNAYTVLWTSVYGASGCCASAFMRGNINEMGAWVATPSAGVRAAMQANMKAYWGTP